nr:uncharacterized protein LOC110089467 isoform X2 [Pogona vitticeps]
MNGSFSKARELGHILISSCLLLTEADSINISVMPDPWLPLEGTEVKIIPEGNIEDVFACCWFRREMSNHSLIFIYELPPESKYHYGKFYTGRETIGLQCSLHITGLTMEDEDLYLLHKQRYEEFPSEYGDTFLMIRHKEEEEEEDHHATSNKVEASDVIKLILIVGCLVGLAVLVGFIAYHTSTRSAGSSDILPGGPIRYIRAGSGAG